MKKLSIVILCSIFVALEVSAVEVPKEIMSRFKGLGCEIAVYSDQYGNKHRAITQGAFSKTGNVDWAALCVESSKKALKVIWGNEKACVSSFEVYGESVLAVGIDWMKTHIEAYAPNKTFPPLNHDGIDVGIGMGSSVYYCSEKRWYILPGSD